MSDEEKTLPAVAGNTSVVTTDEDIDFSMDAGAGFENVTESMKIIPFVRVLQDLSPQTKKTRKEYIEGAKPGMFWETASNTFYPGEEGVTIIPIHIVAKWIEWVPRDNGGGLVKRWDNDAYKRTPGYIKDEKGSKYHTPDGNEIVEYLDVYCLVVDDQGGWKAAVFSTKSTAIQAARSLITMADQLRIVHPQSGRRFRPAMFYSAFSAKLKEQSNESGTWYGVSFTRVNDTVNLPGGKDIYRAAADLHKQIVEGQVGVNDAELEDENTSGATPRSGPTDNEIGNTI